MKGQGLAIAGLVGLGLWALSKKAKIAVREADGIIASYTAPGNLANYVNLLSDANPVKQELLTRPEVKEALALTAFMNTIRG